MPKQRETKNIDIFILFFAIFVLIFTKQFDILCQVTEIGLLILKF